MKALRWTLLFPAFVIYILLGSAICKLIAKVGQGWSDTLFGQSLVTLPIIFYAIGLHFTLKVAPNVLIGARILLVINLIIYGFAYSKTGFDLPWLTLTFDGLTILVLVMESFLEKGIGEFLN